MLNRIFVIAFAISCFAHAARADDPVNLGNGYEMFQYPAMGERFVPNSCIDILERKKTSGEGVRYSLDLAMTQYDLDRFVGTGAGFAVRTPAVKANASFSKITEIKIRKSDVVLLASAKRIFASDTITSFQLKSEFVPAKPIQLDHAFFQKCGTAFISQIDKSAEVIVALRISFESGEKKEKFLFEANQKVGTNVAEETFQTVLNEYSSKYTVQNEFIAVGTKKVPTKEDKKSPSNKLEDVIRFIIQFGSDQLESGALVEADAANVIGSVSKYTGLPTDLNSRLSSAEKVYKRAALLQTLLESMSGDYEAAISTPGAFYPKPQSVPKMNDLVVELKKQMLILEESWADCVNSIKSSTLLCDLASFAQSAFNFEKDNRNKLISSLYSIKRLDPNNNAPQDWDQITESGKRRIFSVVGQIFPGKGSIWKSPAALGQESAGGAQCPNSEAKMLNYFVSALGSNLKYNWTGCDVTYDRSSALLHPYTGAFCVTGPADVWLLFPDSWPPDNEEKGAKMMVFEVPDDVIEVGMPCPPLTPSAAAVPKTVK